MKKQIIRGISIRFIIALLIFGACYAASQQQIPQSQWLENQIDYYMVHNSDIKTITKHTIENAKILFETVTARIIDNDKTM